MNTFNPGDRVRLVGFPSDQTERVVFGYSPNGERVGYWRWRCDGAWEADSASERALVLVPPRPTIKDSWGYIDGDGYVACRDEAQARRFSGEAMSRPLARCIAGRICDEHGEPLEPAS